MKLVPSNSHEEYTGMPASTAKLSYSMGLADTMCGTLMKDLPLDFPPGIKRVQVLFLQWRAFTASVLVIYHCINGANEHSPRG